MTNRLKGLDVIDRMTEELWIEVPDIVQEAGIKTIPKGKKKWPMKTKSSLAPNILVPGQENIVLSAHVI